MECIALICQALLDPGDARRGRGADLPRRADGVRAAPRPRSSAIPMDDDGLVVDALAERLEAGCGPKFLYVIPEYQNPTGRTLPLERRRRAGRAVPPPRRADLRGRRLPRAGVRRRRRCRRCGRSARTSCCRRARSRRVFFPGVRLGLGGRARRTSSPSWPPPSSNTDQCAGALGQRMVEEYGRAGHFERQLPAARALYASHWRGAVGRARARTCPRGVSWTRADRRLPHLADAADGARRARAAPRRHRRPASPTSRAPPFYVGDGGTNELRLSFSHLTEPELETAAERLAGVLASALSSEPARLSRS